MTPMYGRYRQVAQGCLILARTSYGVGVDCPTAGPDHGSFLRSLQQVPISLVKTEFKHLLFTSVYPELRPPPYWSFSRPR